MPHPNRPVVAKVQLTQEEAALMVIEEGSTEKWLRAKIDADLYSIESQ